MSNKVNNKPKALMPKKAKKPKQWFECKNQHNSEISAILNILNQKGVKPIEILLSPCNVVHYYVRTTIHYYAEEQLIPNS